MKKIRIAAGAGFAGDRIEPALDIIERGNADYIIFECLAERTIALAQKNKREHPGQGYNSLLDHRMEKIAPLLKKHPIKIVTNMGAANPIAAADRIYEILCAYDLASLKIAVVEGDDVFSDISSYFDLPAIETGESLGALAGDIILIKSAHPVWSCRC